MRILIANFAGIILISSSAMAQDPTPGYYLIYGNPDGSTIDVHIDSDIGIKVWIASPAIGSGYEDLNGDGIVDSILVIFNPLASNDSVIVSRDGGEVFDPLTSWYVNDFLTPGPDSTPGYTNQSFWGIAFDVSRCCVLGTLGDTMHIATFYMHSTSDSSLINETLCPLIAGYDIIAGSGTVFELDRYPNIAVYPFQIFSCLYFVDYLPGDANRSGDVNGLDVLYMVGYLKGYFPPPDPIFAGDANGDCLANGLDVTYLVAYFKGTGPGPFLGSCH